MANNDFKFQLFKKNKHLQQSLFWGEKYKLLNSCTPLKDNQNKTYFDLQVEKLNSRDSIKEYDTVNNFLNTINTQTVTLQNAEGQFITYTENQLYTRLMELLNSGLWQSDLNTKRLGVEQGLRGVQLKNYQEEENLKIIAEITSVLQGLKISTENGVGKEVIELLENRLRTMNKNAYDYYQTKSKQAEELFTAILMQKGLMTITTGDFRDSKGQQLIEDNMTLLPGATANVASIFQKYFNEVEKMNGKYSISLPDEYYDLLQSGAVLMTQVKSGLNQSILNKNERNSISLIELDFSPIELWELFNEPNASSTWFLPYSQQKSLDLSAYANYALSKGIAKTNLKRNQLYFTRYGVTTASQWIQLSQQVLAFTDPVKAISNDFLTKHRKYSFVNQLKS